MHKYIIIDSDVHWMEINWGLSFTKQVETLLEKVEFEQKSEEWGDERNFQAKELDSVKYLRTCVYIHSLSCVWHFVIPWTAAHLASLSFTISWSLLKLMSFELMMPSNYLILCRPLFLLPSIFPSIRVFSSE